MLFASALLAALTLVAARSARANDLQIPAQTQSYSMSISSSAADYSADLGRNDFGYGDRRESHRRGHPSELDMELHSTGVRMLSDSDYAAHSDYGDTILNR